MHRFRLRSHATFALTLVVSLAWSSYALADDHLRGVILAHNEDGTLNVTSDDSTEVIVVIEDYTKVRRTTGVRRRSESPASLIPGLRIMVDGSFDDMNRLLADRIQFSRSDLKLALAIRGGVNPTDRRSLENQQKIAEGARILAQQQETLNRQAQQIASNSTQIEANNEKMVATTGALGSRIGNLDNYDVVSTVTVYFRNGSATIAPKYRKQLQELAAQATTVNGYAIQVQGFASAVGSYALNQRLSRQRADNVTAILQQAGVTPTNVVVPAAMGTTGQVASNKTAKGQAENRRTVVKLLQNKGISER